MISKLTHKDSHKIWKYYELLLKCKKYMIEKTLYETASYIRDVEITYFITVKMGYSGISIREIDIEGKYNSFSDFDYESYCEDLLNILSKSPHVQGNIQLKREINLYLTLTETPFSIGNIEKFISEILD